MTVPVEIPDPAVIPTVQVSIGGVALALRDPAVTPTVEIDWGTGSTTVFPADPFVDVEWGQAGISVLPPPAVVDIAIGVGVQGPLGPEGGPGPAGPPGPPGPAGGAPFVFTQSSPSTFWHIVHGYGADPSVAVRRNDGVTVGAFGSVYSADGNTVDLYFGQPLAGVATLNF